MEGVLDGIIPITLPVFMPLTTRASQHKYFDINIFSQIKTFIPRPSLFIASRFKSH
jgi:hypothetical protein